MYDAVGQVRREARMPHNMQLLCCVAQNNNKKAEEYVRLLRTETKLHAGVEACVRAALNEYSPHTQKLLLQVHYRTRTVHSAHTCDLEYSRALYELELESSFGMGMGMSYWYGLEWTDGGRGFGMDRISSNGSDINFSNRIGTGIGMQTLDMCVRVRDACFGSHMQCK